MHTSPEVDIYFEFLIIKTICLFKWESLNFFCGLQCGPVYKHWTCVIKIRKLEESNLWFPFVQWMDVQYTLQYCSFCEKMYTAGTNCWNVSIQFLASSIFYSVFYLHILFDWQRSEELIFQIINACINHTLVFPDALRFKSFQQQKSLNLHVKLLIFYWEEIVLEILASYVEFLRVSSQGRLVKEVFTLQNQSQLFNPFYT